MKKSIVSLVDTGSEGTATNEQAMELINEFFAKISHEIRTPVNALQQAAHQLQQELNIFNHKDINSLTSIMIDESERLARTIDLLVDYAALKSGTYHLKTEKFDLFQDVLAALFASYKTTAEAKGVRLVINSTTLNTEISADKYSVRQILKNLIENAVAFTEKGVIEVDIKRTDSAGLVVSVVDTGIGIEENLLDNIFQPFVQESKGYSRSFDGMGLGLAVTKGFCDLNGFEISLQSQKEAGTVVTVKF